MTSIYSQQSLFSGQYAVQSSTSVGQGARLMDDPQSALAKLQESALTALAREIPGMESKDLKALDPNEYTPDKIANRIGQFVAMGLENARRSGKSDEDVQRLYESAVEGVKQGFADAKEILSNLDVLKGDIASQVEDTERLTFDALAGIAPGQQQDVADIAATRSVGMAERYRSAEDFSLTLKTRDGDEVEIRFGRDLQAEATLGFAEDDQGNRVSIMEMSRSERSGFQLSVTGNLDADELDAIHSLIQDVNKMADDFFSGNVQAAFDQAADVDFDSSQLASMDLQMSRSTQYSAARRYQETQQAERPELTDASRRLGHLMNDMRETFARPELDFIEQLSDVASQIMRGLVEQDSRFKDANEDERERFSANLDRLVEGLRPRTDD